MERGKHPNRIAVVEAWPENDLDMVIIDVTMEDGTVYESRIDMYDVTHYWDEYPPEEAVE